MAKGTKKRKSEKAKKRKSEKAKKREKGAHLFDRAFLFDYLGNPAGTRLFNRVTALLLAVSAGYLLLP